MEDRKTRTIKKLEDGSKVVEVLERIYTRKSLFMVYSRHDRRL